jgi:maltooligosyltrehalose synthase
LSVPSGAWRNCLTREPIPGGEVWLADLLRQFPVALLVKETA